MKLLHTADWHVGRTIRGRSRADEHRAVLAAIARTAADEAVDIVIIAGDLFDGSAPTAESEDITYRALLALAEAGAEVLVIAGNHDHPKRLAAVRPLLDLTRVRVASHVARPRDGGVIDVRTRGGEIARIALVPFLSQRAIITADQLMEKDAADHVQKYADRYRSILARLCDEFDAECVNIVVAHTTVIGARPGGGEREAHTLGDYHVPAAVFPATAHYVALGHIHRAQPVAAGVPAWYSGSPLQLDFGESANEPRVLIVEAEPGVPASVHEVPVEGSRRLRTLRGTLEQLREQVTDSDDDFLRIVLREPRRSGLADDARSLFPNAVDVAIEAADDDVADAAMTLDSVRGSPIELFDEYMLEKQIDDAALRSLFAELLHEASAA